jgi:uncharacterized membrane protein
MCIGLWFLGSIESRTTDCYMLLRIVSFRLILLKKSPKRLAKKETFVLLLVSLSAPPHQTKTSEAKAHGHEGGGFGGGGDARPATPAYASSASGQS